ncbi:phosphoenolpyruvate carboxylase [Candidatus Brocadiaceae bacterium]|nr:phosphoenolpyruvate carboxylase [Candidatus Brocadiaceae bacterium]
MTMSNNNYQQIVFTRYHIYNSLFLNLPFKEVYQTGTLLPLLGQACEQGFQQNKTPVEIIEGFFNDYAPHITLEERFKMLFLFIQYVERQVVLFDALEEAAFEQINDLNGDGTMTALISQVHADHATERLKEKLKTFSVRLVLTAHPTQFYPGSVLAIIKDLEEAAHDNDVDQINLLLQQLAKTAFYKREKPTPLDEAISLCWYLEFVFYPAIAGIIEQLAQGLKIPVAEWINPHLIQIGFWPGGDRDGNPYVTHDVTLQVAQKLRETVLRCYHRQLRTLKRRLSFKGVDTLMAEAEQRLYQSLYGGQNVYNSAFEFEQVLWQARKCLINEHDGLFLNLLDNLLLNVRIFGFHFASMDIRQESKKHHQLWQYIIGELHHQGIAPSVAEFDALPENEQINCLLNLDVDLHQINIDEPLMTEMLNTFLAIKSIQHNNGEAGCHRYIISHCGSALQVIEVFKLAQLLIANDDNKLALDIIPLFESIEDLDIAHQVIHNLYDIPMYRQHLQTRGNKQTIMLGFSDGTKDGGYLCANWSIFRAKEELTRISRQYGITAIFFDGRGGPPSRGGGNTHNFYASLGETIENEEVQITIQGQTISSNYGKVQSCRYNLEQLISAGVMAFVFPHNVHSFNLEEKQLMNKLAEESHKAYLALKHDSQFVPYLQKMTPLLYFGETNIGSRPVKRNTDGELRFEELRAIPFVGAWAQMKQNLPGFYGVGIAIAHLTEQGELEKLQTLHRRSLFFRTLLGNSMMSLTKSYYPITSYIGNDPEFGELWHTMYAEFNLAREKILTVSGLSALMEDNIDIRHSIRLREQIVLPIIAIQQYALQQLRADELAGKESEKEYRTLVLRCMFGIINAARNSA